MKTIEDMLMKVTEEFRTNITVSDQRRGFYLPWFEELLRRVKNVERRMFPEWFDAEIKQMYYENNLITLPTLEPEKEPEV